MAPSSLTLQRPPMDSESDSEDKDDVSDDDEGIIQYSEEIDESWDVREEGKCNCFFESEIRI